MQNYELKDRDIGCRFSELPSRKAPLRLSWSNWSFGDEPLERSLARLAKYEVGFVELHGNHYGLNRGYAVGETIRLLKRYGIGVSGICGMFSRENDLSGISCLSRQAALDYLLREIDFAQAVGAEYLLVVPGAVGRSEKYDDGEFERSVETILLAADRFVAAGVRAAIEPIRSAEVSFCHTVADARRYIAAVGHPGVRHINGDVYHMQSEEPHIGEAILQAGTALANLHVADSNRLAPGAGSMDFATVIKALYILQHAGADFFVTAEPLGPGADPYTARSHRYQERELDAAVEQSVGYLRALEASLAVGGGK